MIGKRKARKRFGQHFLIDPMVIQHIVDLIDPKSTDAMVEIGPGLGALTKPILNAVDHLNIIELDRDLAKTLEDTFANAFQTQALSLHTGDALKFNFASLFRTQKLRIIGNLPYNISTPLLFYLLNFKSIIQDMHFMLQKEVVDRITAQPNTKAYGRLSIMLQSQCRVQSLFTIEPNAFHPPPKVRSQMLRLIPYTIPPYPIQDLSLLQNITALGFNQRRKIIANTLKDYLTEKDFESLMLSPQLRPEALSVQNFVDISNYIANKE